MHDLSDVHKLRAAALEVVRRRPGLSPHQIGAELGITSRELQKRALTHLREHGFVLAEGALYDRRYYVPEAAPGRAPRPNAPEASVPAAEASSIPPDVRALVDTPAVRAVIGRPLTDGETWGAIRALLTDAAGPR